MVSIKDAAIIRCAGRAGQALAHSPAVDVSEEKTRDRVMLPNWPSMPAPPAQAAPQRARHADPPHWAFDAAAAQEPRQYEAAQTGPTRFLAIQLGTDAETVIRRLVALLVMLVDPSAVVLTIAASRRN